MKNHIIVVWLRISAFCCLFTPLPGGEVLYEETFNDGGGPLAKRLVKRRTECTIAPGNVIVIMTDDQGYGDLGCHGNKHIRTPHLDRLHSESVRFTDFHVNPFCSPTRAALLTGRFSDLTTVRSTIHGDNHLAVDETTMAEYFKASGYASGHFGKWHIGANYPFRPNDRGFDESLSIGDGGMGSADNYWGADKMNDHYLRNGKWERHNGFMTDVFFNESMKFISKNSEKPFFIYLATNAPHLPWHVPIEERQAYEGQLDEFRHPNASYHLEDFFGTLTRFDRNVGRLREFLARNNLAENTIVIYLTDNGTLGGEIVNAANMRGIKGSPYEGGHRVPCFFHWPAGGFVQGRDLDQLTAHIDILPTLIEFCGLKPPCSKAKELSGISWASLMRSGKWEHQDRALFLHSQNISPEYTKWQNSLVATGKWRLVGQDQLYNIAEDPGQRNNVAQKYPKVVKDLQSRYEDYWKRIGSGKFPKQRPVIGTGNIDTTFLATNSWTIFDKKDPLAYGQSSAAFAVKGKGYWPIQVAKRKQYRIEVRRWPREVSSAMNEQAKFERPPDISVRGKLVKTMKGKALDLKAIRLKVGDSTHEKRYRKGDRSADFMVTLEQGETEIQAWLIDKNNEIYPAYFIYIEG